MDIYPVKAIRAALGDFLFPPMAYNAAVIFETPAELLDFENIQGRRTLEMHGQNGWFANNEMLRYIFRGYTADGEYALYVTFPITAPFLPSSSDPAATLTPRR
ncbi:MAG: hypothetical protein D6803_08515 [Anaerolineae bacterium]|nr:MAG: hypothetical protein D6803_08515 [Anaerolineae bacterium]